MRIISGELGGRRIKVPRNLPIRPTTDQAKEGIFNIISNKVNLQGLKILDLFSGSGMIGFEFISRGAKVTFVEKNIKCVKHISLTINELNITSKIIKQDVFKFLSNCTTNFDIIFADPPYSFDDEDYNKLINLIDTKFLNDSSRLFILEHYKKKGFLGVKNFIDERNYGDCSFTFFQQKSG